MIRRAVEISREPCHLAVRNDQLLILRRTAPPQPLPAQPDGLAAQIPLEDLGVLMVDECATTYSHAVLVKVAENGGALVVCGRDHLPCGMLLPLSRNTALMARLKTQISLSKPRRKRIWAALVAAKIRAQAGNLAHAPQVRARLLSMSRRVKSGDPENLEAQAAQAYWPALFVDPPGIQSPFRRCPGEVDSSPPNNLLDYGYAVLRSVVGRAIVSAGLLPALGVQHHQRSNAFCLADDLMEPLRPLLDAKVRALVAKQRLTLDQPTKAELIGVMTMTVRCAETTGPLGVAVVRYVASFVREMDGEGGRLEVPLMAEGSSGDSPRAEPEEDA